MKKILISTLGMLFMTASAFAASVGVSGTALYYSASGTETTKSSAEKNDKSDSGFAPMASVFVEQELGTGVTVGLDVMPYSAKIGSGSMDKDDDAETSGTNKVDVNFKNHVTLYAEIPTDFGGIDGGFIKLGVHIVSLEIDDVLSTGVTMSRTIQSMREAGAEVSLCTVLVNKTVRNEIDEVPLRGIIRVAVV